jgi:phage/plasmid-associated DNA primase
MEHCGSDLTNYLSELPWCKDWGLTTGGDYLTAWVACMLQNPFGKLPYLFMYGPQNSGKSSFHESIALLLTSGVAKADRALTSEQGYNGELQDAVLAVVDEVDISKAGSGVYNKLKEWVTGITVSIHAKYKPVQDVTSTLHFVQMSNSRDSLPVFPGDTRITAMHVPDLEEGVEIPREKLQILLKQEAPAFMRTLMDFEIAEATGRLMIPVIETQGKLEAAAGNIDEVNQFIEDNCYTIPGTATKFADFETKFLESLEEFQRPDWKRRLIRNALSERFPIGKGTSANQLVIGNLTFNPTAEPSEPYTQSGSKLVKDMEL